MRATLKLLLAVPLFMLIGGLAMAQTATPTATPTNTPTPLPQQPNPSLTLTVASGGTVSNLAELGQPNLYSVTIYAPTTLAETATIDITDSIDTGTFRAYQQVIGTDTVIAAGKAVTVQLQGAAFRIKLNGNAASARSFVVFIQKIR